MFFDSVPEVMDSLFSTLARIDKVKAARGKLNDFLLIFIKVSFHNLSELVVPTESHFNISDYSASDEFRSNNK